MNEAMTSGCAKVCNFLFPISWLCVAIVILILLPMALFRATRPKAGYGMFLISYVFGLTTWFLGATITFGTWGWFGLIVGLIIAGVGVVPIAILASFISLKSPALGFFLIFMVVLVFAIRMGGAALMTTKE